MQSKEFIQTFSKEFQTIYNNKKILLPFSSFLELVQENPRKYTRNSAQYVTDTFDYFKKTSITSLDPLYKERFNLFDIGTERSGPIIGGEPVQIELYNMLKSFNRSGFVSKLILLHGPNGSAKTSTIETLSKALERYSESEGGAVYKFNWVFPTDKDKIPRGQGELQPIGFGQKKEGSSDINSYALIDEGRIASRIPSEFKENPLFIIPMPYRETYLRQWIAAKEGIREEDVELEPHILLTGLSKKNQEIFENLLNAYEGDVSKVFRHVQIERFFFSRQYRIGISTVQPQMSIDAGEKQLTLDKNLMNMPAVLQTMNFFQASGELVEANRGILEFSDLLKRPVESFKYLLNTIEKGTINLNSSTALLDVVFLATTNDKHLDAFKSIPDFSSFKGRFELIPVPYLLRPSLEEKIYETDIKAISKFKTISPHAIETLCTWAVMTRFKQPDLELFPKKYRPLITKLDPKMKTYLYEGKSLQPIYSLEEENILQEIKEKLWQESHSSSGYEGRFGASPREIRAILYRASQNPTHEELTPMAIFDELESMIKDRSIYEFLQFEPRAKFHDVDYFTDTLKKEFVETFEREAVQAMSLADEAQYDTLLKRYISHVVADIKKEKLWDESSNSYIHPSIKIMSDVEKILKISISADEFRASLLNRIAAFKIDNPSKSSIELSHVFKDLMVAIKQHFYEENKKIIEDTFKIMIRLEKDHEMSTISDKDKNTAELTYNNLQTKFGYSRRAAFKCLSFVLIQKNQMENA